MSCKVYKTVSAQKLIQVRKDVIVKDKRIEAIYAVIFSILFVKLNLYISQLFLKYST